MRSEFKNSVQIEKLWLICRCYSNIKGKQIQSLCLYLERFTPGKIDLLMRKEKSHKLGYYHEKQKKNKFALREIPSSLPFLVN